MRVESIQWTPRSVPDVSETGQVTSALWSYDGWTTPTLLSSNWDPKGREGEEDGRGGGGRNVDRGRVEETE